MWCGRCYCAAEEESFPLTKPQEEEGFDLTQSEDRLRHLCVRDGDHLLVPFQCDLCRFRNLTNGNPGHSVKDFVPIWMRFGRGSWARWRELRRKGLKLEG